MFSGGEKHLGQPLAAPFWFLAAMGGFGKIEVDTIQSRFFLFVGFNSRLVQFEAFLDCVQRGGYLSFRGCR